MMNHISVVTTACHMFSAHICHDCMHECGYLVTAELFDSGLAATWLRMLTHACNCPMLHTHGWGFCWHL